MLATLKALKLVTGRGRTSDLVRLAHSGRLVGALSVSLQVSPDEVIGGLTSAMGAEARELRVLDVRTGTPMVIEVGWRELHEKWELVDVPALAHNLNDLYRGLSGVKAVAVLGEWHDMVQLWCIDKTVLPTLLDRRVLDGAMNLATLRRMVEGSEADEPFAKSSLRGNLD